jgi:hypothetical protein
MFSHFRCLCGYCNTVVGNIFLQELLVDRACCIDNYASDDNNIKILCILLTQCIMVFCMIMTDSDCFLHWFIIVMEAQYVYLQEGLEIFRFCFDEFLQNANNFWMMGPFFWDFQ